MALLLISGTANAVSTGGTFNMYDPSGTLINADATITAVLDKAAGTWGIKYSFLWPGVERFSWCAVGRRYSLYRYN